MSTCPPSLVNSPCCPFLLLLTAQLACDSFPNPDCSFLRHLQLALLVETILTLFTRAFSARCTFHLAQALRMALSGVLFLSMNSRRLVVEEPREPGVPRDILGQGEQSEGGDELVWEDW